MHDCIDRTVAVWAVVKPRTVCARATEVGTRLVWKLYHNGKVGYLAIGQNRENVIAEANALRQQVYAG